MAGAVIPGGGALALKRAVFHAARACGLFALARRATRDRVRILAYHGFATGDESRFRTKLFIQAGTFERRLALLARRGYRVVTLDDAVRALRRGAATGAQDRDRVVITIDDGYASTLHVAAPRLARHRMPAIVYLTSYHMRTQTPVFDLAVAYVCWKTSLPHASWQPAEGAPAEVLDLATPAARAAVADAVVARGRAAGSEAARVELVRRLAAALAVDAAELERRGAFRLLSADEARALAAHGVQVGLHTHRHRFPPTDLDTCRRELHDNREHLRAMLGEGAVTNHFCYPSGVWSEAQWALLEAEGIESSTTCDTGLARPGDPLHGLVRFLDGESVSEIEFEAELSGFAPLLRQALGVRRQAGGGR